MNGPRFCWECGAKLVYRAGKLSFVLKDVDGIPVRVHKECGDDTRAELKRERHEETRREAGSFARRRTKV